MRTLQTISQVDSSLHWQNTSNYLSSWQHICGWMATIYEIFNQTTCLKI